MAARVRSAGFTIVELLIVVVVIAILAAITIVAYNGIQNRAKSSAVQSTASQAAKKIGTYAVTNNDTYPDSLTTASLPTVAGTTYDYFTDASMKKFCVSATSNALSFAGSNGSGGVVPGRCATNYALNPSAEGTTNLVVSTGAPVLTISSDSFSGWPISGSRSFRVDATTASETRPRTQNNTIPIVAGEPIQASFYVRNAAASSRTFYVGFQGRTSGGSAVGVQNSAAVVIAAGAIARVTGVLSPDQYATTFSGAAFIEPMLSRSSSGAAANDVFYIDDIFVSYGNAVTSYGDGSTANWAWSGVNNDSTSFGPTQ